MTLRRTGRRSAAALAAAVVFAACHAPANGVARPDEGPLAHPVDPVVLTPASPVARVPMDPAVLPARADVAEVHVSGVANPRGEAFAVRVRIVWGEGAQAVLGTIGVHPPDQPGRYLLAAGPALARARAAGPSGPGGAPHLVLELLPVAEDRPLTGPLEVRVGPVLWYEAP